MSEPDVVFASSDCPRVIGESPDVGLYDHQSSVVDQHRLSIREDWVVVEAPESEILRAMQTKALMALLVWFKTSTA